MFTDVDVLICGDRVCPFEIDFAMVVVGGGFVVITIVEVGCVGFPPEFTEEDALKI